MDSQTQTLRDIGVDDVSKVHIIPEERQLQSDSYIAPTSLSDFDSSAFDLWEQEFKIDPFSNTGSGESSENFVTECICVDFADDCGICFLPGQKVIDVTALISGETDEIEMPTAECIMPNRIILLRTKSSDIIEETADEILESEGKSDYRSNCEIWSTLLNKVVAKFGFDAIYNEYRNCGGNVGGQTFKNWINGLVFVPQRDDDLPIVLKALSAFISEDARLMQCKSHYREILEMGRYLQKTHRNRAPAVIKEKLKNRTDEITDIFNSIRKKGEIDGIGEISLHVVSQCRSIQVSKDQINRLEEY